MNCILHKWEAYVVNTGYFNRIRYRCKNCDALVRIKIDKELNLFGITISWHAWEKLPFRASEDSCPIPLHSNTYEHSGARANDLRKPNPPTSEAR